MKDEKQRDSHPTERKFPALEVTLAIVGLDLAFARAFGAPSTPSCPAASVGHEARGGR